MFTELDMPALHADVPPNVLRVLSASTAASSYGSASVPNTCYGDGAARSVVARELAGEHAPAKVFCFGTDVHAGHTVPGACGGEHLFGSFSGARRHREILPLFPYQGRFRWSGEGRLPAFQRAVVSADGASAAPAEKSADTFGWIMAPPGHRPIISSQRSRHS